MNTNKILDSVALFVALIVDLVLNVVAMVMISPGPWVAAGFVAVAFLVVVFGVRAWIKGNKLLWAIFALSALFFDVSFILAATASQTKAVELVQEAGEDPELARLRGVVAEYEASLVDLQRQFNEAMQRDTMDSLERQMEQVRADKREVQDKYDARLEKVESGELARIQTQREAQISAAAVFNAIPDAFMAARFIELSVFLLLFTGLQLTIITAAEQERSKDTAEPQEEAPAPKPTPPPEPKLKEPIKKALVLGNLIVLENPIVVRRELNDFVKQYFDQGAKIPPYSWGVTYDQIKEVLERCKLIDENGKILTTKQKALSVIGMLNMRNYGK